MNILYIITGLGIGGAEKVTVDLANLMQDKGNMVIINIHPLYTNLYL